MAISRKCPKCQIWNESQDYCQSCNELLSPTLIEEVREKEREVRRVNKPKSSLDFFLEKWENSRFFILRVFYKVCYSIVAIVMSIAFFFAYITVGSNG